MSQEADKKMEGLDLCMGIARLRVDARATIKVKGVEVTKIYPGDIDPDNRIGRSNLAAWLAASKVGSVYACEGTTMRWGNEKYDTYIICAFVLFYSFAGSHLVHMYCTCRFPP